MNDLVSLEKEVLEFWRREKVFEASLKKREGKPAFVFYEGPPTANGKPGIHHVLARAIKDLIPRFKTMQGYQVARRAGWDTHGLPVEIEVEKQLGISGKKQIENLVPGDKFASIKKFNGLAKESVWKYKKEWEDLTERIGFWLDMQNPYVTYSNSYIEKLWAIIKKLQGKGLLYKGYKVVPHCPRCGTTLSSHEVALGYEEVTEPSVYVTFEILDGAYKGDHIVAWTTTPWTLPGNAALAVGREIDYVQAKAGDRRIIAAKATLKNIADNLLDVKSVSADKLIGSHYQPLYPFLAKKGRDVFTVVEADFVSTQEGSGVVHTAVMYGEEDYELGRKYDLPKIHTVAEDGRFKDFVKPFAGMFVKDADKKIIEDLKSRGQLFKKEDYTHTYPFCWRCATPLLYYGKDSWFVRMSALIQQLTINNQQINWIPGHLKDGRFGEFLREVKDWAFSRERYWGTPLPVWVCDICQTVEVVGNVDELRSKLQIINYKLQTNPKSQNPNSKIINYQLSISQLDLHRPFVDEITWACEKCPKGTMRREPYVVDAWFDSGAMPYASGEKDAGRFPADYIAEGLDQTRGWFYTLLAVATTLGDPAPYKNVLCHGLVLDGKGQKMSKSKGNVVDPWEVIKKHGADAVRWYFYAVNQPEDNKPFVEKDLITYKNKTLGLLWNVYNYYETYSKIQNAKFKSQSENAKFKILDDWIAARLHETIKVVTDNLEQYQITDAARSITALIDDLSTWHLRRSRKRTDKEFFNTLYSVLETIAKLIAPFMPFNAEALCQKIRSPKFEIRNKSQIQNYKLQTSVHLDDWPKFDEKLINGKLLSDMAKVREIVSQTLKLRADAKIKVRQPLQQLTIINYQLKNELLNIIADEVNVSNVKTGKKFALDTKITPRLKAEGIARDIERAIQDTRKRAGCDVSERVKAWYVVQDKAVLKVLTSHKKSIETRTLTTLNSGVPKKYDGKLDESGFSIYVGKA